MNSSVRPRVAAGSLGAALLFGGLLIAGCGSSGSTSTSGSPSTSTNAASTPAAPSPTPAAPSPTGAPPSSDGLGSIAPPAASGDPAAVALIAQSTQSLAAVSSVRLKGTTAEGGESFTIDMTFKPGTGATGSIQIAGGTIQLLTVGNEVYFKFDQAAFEAFASQGGDSGEAIPPAAEQLFVGRWLKTPSDDTADFGDLGSLTDFSEFTQEVLSPSGSLSLRPGTTTVDGQQVKAIIDSGDGGDDGGTLYVQAGGGHLPVELTAGDASGGGAGQLHFTDYNKPVTITAPSDALDLGALMQLDQSPPAS